jgi:membrane-associated phospholipid phosphatase
LAGPERRLNGTCNGQGMTDSKLAAKLLFGTAAFATLAFGAVTSAALRGKTSRFDKHAQRGVHGAKSDGGRAHVFEKAARVTTPLGKWWANVPASLTAARRLQRAGRGAGAVTLVGTAVGAALLSVGLDKVLRHRLPPPERHEPSEQSYPSGHALQSSALALATGYVLQREGLARAWSVAPLGLAALAAGAGRLFLDRHWTTDVVGGYCAGIAFGATCAGIYELSRPHALRLHV